LKIAETRLTTRMRSVSIGSLYPKRGSVVR
jgi:hypothetical protein